MTSKLKNNDIEVTKQDQQNINAFSRLFLKKQEVEAFIHHKKQLMVQNDDALTELEMNDDDEIVSTKFGVCFFNISSARARELIEDDQKKLKVETTQLLDSLDDTVKRMKKLKATLYGKFGNSINLEQ